MSRMREIAAACLVLASGFPSAGSEPAPLRVSRDASLATVAAGDRPILTYRHGDAPFKPYVKTLCTPSGVQILRDSPADHVHHRGLMFALEINKADFWAETRRSGKQVPVGALEAGESAGGGVRIVQKLNWIPAGDEKPVAVEERRIEVHGTAHGATLLTWRTTLSAAEGRAPLSISGSHYQGLGMRFVQSMDGAETFLHAAGGPGPDVRGVERVTASAWSAYTASADGNPVTAAIFDHPRNPRHPAGVFSMHKPFTYLSATPNVCKAPLSIGPGESLDLRYGVAVWDGAADRERIEQAYQAWLRLAGDAAGPRPGGG